MKKLIISAFAAMSVFALGITASAANGAGNVVNGAVNGAGQVVEGVVEGAGEIVGGVVNGVGDAVGGAVNGAGEVINGVTDGTNDTTRKTPDVIAPNNAKDREDFPNDNTTENMVLGAEDTKNPSTGVDLVNVAVMGISAVGLAGVAASLKKRK